MRALIILFSFMGSLCLVHCSSCKITNSLTILSDMEDICAKKIKEQIQMEIDASMEYMMMGAHFSKDNINRPGFAKFFFHSAGEERQHAYKFIQYLLMRGLMNSDLRDTIMLTKTKAENRSWDNGLKALKKALVLEKSVTESIKKIMVACEQARTNDYHAVDYLINEFLDEQYRGQRDLAGKISELNRMENSQGSLGEFLFDKKLLKEELV